MKAFLAYLRLQFLLLRLRVLPRIVLLAVVLAAVLPVVLSDAGPGEGFRVLANAADLVVTAIIILVTVMAAVSIAGDASSGALRAVMIRPISRNALVVGNALVLLLSAAVLHFVGVTIAFFVTRSVIGYAAVEDQGYVMFTLQEMLGHSRSLLFLPLPAILCAPLVALLISATVDDVALAVVISLAIVMGPYLFGSLVDGMPEWLFTEQASLPIRILRGLSHGITTDLRDLEQGSIAYDAISVPCLYAAVLLGVSLLVFNLRDRKA